MTWRCGIVCVCVCVDLLPAWPASDHMHSHPTKGPIYLVGIMNAVAANIHAVANYYSYTVILPPAWLCVLDVCCSNAVVRALRNGKWLNLFPIKLWRFYVCLFPPPCGWCPVGQPPLSTFSLPPSLGEQGKPTTPARPSGIWIFHKSILLGTHLHIREPLGMDFGLKNYGCSQIRMNSRFWRLKSS